ncbi:phosphate regulon transcriptional regulatory protein phoB [Streptomyces sp. NL15-2K]|nr:phosphate regulon transcriptional regulatory protein phoB [Streptomyces sp. NL15-2K]
MCAHVLVAEDDEMQAELIRRSLLAEGHTATVVHDGRAALDAAHRLRPDLVVLDLMLPVIDGFGMCRVLRRDDDIPVLMLTARTAEDDVLLGLELGADDYMTKPYSPRELMARIRRSCGAAGARAPTGGTIPPSVPGVSRSIPYGTRCGATENPWSARRPSSRSSSPWPPNRNGCSTGGSCWRSPAAPTGPPRNGPSTSTS